MNPYTILGISPSASVKEARAAYRRLAQQHHPDRGGSTAKFQEVKAAYEAIESGQATTAHSEPTGGAPYKSSFSREQSAPKPPPKASQKQWKSEQKTAGEPAPGYEARGPRKMPHTQRKGHEHFVTLIVSTKHAFEGCTVPFVHQGTVLEYVVRPGSTTKSVKETFLMDVMIGANTSLVSINIELIVRDDPKPQTRSTYEAKDMKRDNTIILKISALGFFSGGRIQVQDHLGQSIPIQVPPGHDPAVPITVAGKGFGVLNDRGDLKVKFEPTFKSPKDFTTTELKILEQINLQVKK